MTRLLPDREEVRSQRLWPFVTAKSLVLLGGLVLIQTVIVLAVGMGARSTSLIIVGVAAAAPVAALALFLFPRHVLLFVPLLILIPGQLIAVNAFEWVFLAALATCFLREASTRSLRPRIQAIDIVFIVYLLWGFLSVTQAADLRVALVGIKPPIIFFLAFWTGSRILRAEDAPTLLKIYGLLALGVALETAYVLMAKGTFTLLTTRLSGLTDLGWGRSNYIAAVSALAASAVLPLAFLTKGWERALAIAALGAAAFVTLATISRGGTVALAFGLLLGIVLTARRNLGLAVLLLGGIVAAYIVSPIGQASVARFIRPEDVSSVGARFLYFREAIQIALAHPILGVGPDQIPYHTYFYMDANPHNILLKNAADFGFVGMGLYILLLGWVGARAITRWREASTGLQRACSLSLMLVFFVAAINASYEPTLEAPQYGFLFWLLVGSLTAPAQRNSNEASR